MTLLWLGIISKFIMLSLCATFMFLRIITMNSHCKEFNNNWRLPYNILRQITNLPQLSNSCSISAA